jgi:hypothetical protein
MMIEDGGQLRLEAEDDGYCLLGCTLVGVAFGIDGLLRYSRLPCHS